MNKKVTVYPNGILREHFGFTQYELRDQRILETPHGACPERREILPLHFVQGQNDRKRRAQGDTKVVEQLLKTIKGGQHNK